MIFGINPGMLNKASRRRKKVAAAISEHALAMRVAFNIVIQR